jgi:hypothetical protein
LSALSCFGHIGFDYRATSWGFAMKVTIVSAAFLIGTLLAMAPANARNRVSPSNKHDGRAAQQLMKLDPTTRLEEACGEEVMKRAGHEKKGFHPDRAVTSAISQASLTGDALKGDGGAVRNNDEWFRFSFECQASPDHLKVISLTYVLGGPIDKTDWEKYGLW